MKFLCEQEAIADALNIVSKAISHNNTLPVLNNILIKLEKDKAVLVATNLEIAIKVTIDVKIENEGGITVPAKLISNYVSLLPSGEVEFSEESGHVLVVKSKTSHSKIKGIAPDEFPLIPQIDSLGKFVISGRILREMIDKTVFAASSNLARPVLSGVLFDLREKEFILVATDSYRLSETKFTLIDKIDKPLSSIIPARTINELNKILLKHETEDVSVIFSKNQILIKIGNIEIISRLIEGSFPDYEKIIPKDHKTSFLINREELIAAVRKVNLFVEDSHCMKVNLDTGKMFLETEETQVGEEKTVLEGEISGEKNSIAVNSQYLLDILQVLTEEKVIFQMNDKISPVVIRADKDKDFTHIIMPLKI